MERKLLASRANKVIKMGFDSRDLCSLAHIAPKRFKLAHKKYIMILPKMKQNNEGAFYSFI